MTSLKEKGISEGKEHHPGPQIHKNIVITNIQNWIKVYKENWRQMIQNQEKYEHYDEQTDKGQDIIKLHIVI